jgi:hypothetical protein
VLIEREQIAIDYEEGDWRNVKECRVKSSQNLFILSGANASHFYPTKRVLPSSESGLRVYT